MEPDREGHLKDSLYRDAQQSRHYAQSYALSPVSPDEDDVETSVARLYGELLGQLGRQAGYPKLYRRAWETLVQLLLNKDWVTLSYVDGIFHEALPRVPIHDITAVLRDHAHEFSVWHLKTVLYVWSRPPSPIGSVIGDGAKNLLSLVEIAGVFINMTPQEATLRLAQSQLDNMNTLPYLFRISTTDPGAIAMSFLAPVSGRVLHKRFLTVESLEPFLSSSSNLYRLLVEGFMRSMAGGGSDQNKEIDMNTLILVMRQLDPKLSEPIVRSKLRRIDTLLSVTSSDTSLTSLASLAYETLRSTFFPSAAPKMLTPKTLEERIGVTPSYTSSYVSMSSTVYSMLPFNIGSGGTIDDSKNASRSMPALPCFTCQCEEAVTKEIDNNRLYCSTACYEDDYVLCY